MGDMATLGSTSFTVNLTNALSSDIQGGDGSNTGRVIGGAAADVAIAVGTAKMGQAVSSVTRGANAVKGVANGTKGASSLYETTTSVRQSSGYRSKSSSISNVTTDVTKADFGDNLIKSGYTKAMSADGKATIYTKGDKKYSVRDNAKSTGGSTADYYRNDSKNVTKKIRLED